MGEVEVARYVTGPVPQLGEEGRPAAVSVPHAAAGEANAATALATLQTFARGRAEKACHGRHFDHRPKDGSHHTHRDRPPHRNLLAFTTVRVR